MAFKEKCFYNFKGSLCNCTDNTTEYYIQYQRAVSPSSYEIITEIMKFTSNYNIYRAISYNWNELTYDFGLFFSNPITVYYTDIVMYHWQYFNVFAPTYMVPLYIDFRPNQSIKTNMSYIKFSNVLANALALTNFLSLLLLGFNSIFSEFYFKKEHLEYLENDPYFMKKISEVDKNANVYNSNLIILI